MHQAAEVAIALQLSTKALQFYTPDHPRVVEAVAHLEQTVLALLAQQPRVALTASKGNLLIDGQPFVSPQGHVKTFAAELERRQISGIILSSGISRRELLELVRLLTMRAEQVKNGGGAEAILNRAEVTHVRISHVRYEAVTEGEEVVWAKSVRHIDGPDAATALPAILKALADGEEVKPDDLRAVIDVVANQDEQLTLLRERLVEMGITREHFDELLNFIAWDKLPLDERVESLLEGNRMFALPAGKFQRFIRELLDADRPQPVHRLLERYVTGLAQDATAVRHSVADGLGQIITLQLPRESEQLVGAAILNRFVTEADPRVKNVVAQAAANLLAMLVSTGRCEPALRVLEKLDATAPLAMDALAPAFGEAHRAQELIAQICTSDPDSMARYVMPLVARLGAAIAPHVIEALGSEEDRNRRGRLVKALKTIGEPAFPFLVEALRSHVWFVVRNALNVLGDIGTAAQVDAIGRALAHGDPRVRRAAARALGKIGGADAERLLVGGLNDRDNETQAEVMLCLGSMKAQSAIPGLAELARAKLLGTDDKVRELAVTTIGQIGTDAAVPALGEILRAKSFFARDTPMIRIAAARALSTIKTPAARVALKTAATTESDRATKAAIEKLI
jgi:HEAT repeat protein